MATPDYTGVEQVKSGFVALVGRPNAGKSTLTNALVGSKVAITSDTPQTTRHRLRAVVDRDDSQIVLVDTPGAAQAPRCARRGAEPQRAQGARGRRRRRVAHRRDQAGRRRRPVGGRARRAKPAARRCSFSPRPTSPRPSRSTAQLQRAAVDLGDFDDEVVLSAVEGFNLEGFLAAVVALPAGRTTMVPARHADRPALRGDGRRVHTREDPALDVRRGAARRRRCGRGDGAGREDAISPASGRSSTWSATPRRASSSAGAAR